MGGDVPGGLKLVANKNFDLVLNPHKDTFTLLVTSPWTKAISKQINLNEDLSDAAITGFTIAWNRTLLRSNFSDKNDQFFHMLHNNFRKLDQKAKFLFRRKIYQVNFTFETKSRSHFFAPFPYSYLASAIWATVGRWNSIGLKKCIST